MPFWLRRPERRRPAGAARGRRGSRRGGSNAPGGFKLFDQVGGFDHRQFAQLIH